MDNDFTDSKLIRIKQTYAFVFVCQKGPLEIEAVLLAASLKRFVKCDYELICAIPLPQSVMGVPSDNTLNLLKDMGVRIEYINNTVVEDIITRQPGTDFSLGKNKTFLYANKIFCFNVPTTADKIIFLDSDMLLHQAFHGNACFSIPFNARLDGTVGTAQLDGKWGQLARLVDVRLPSLRIVYKKRKEVHPDDVIGPPCFNAGFIGINAELREEFFATWLDCYKKLIVVANELLQKPRFSEQIALTLAVYKMNLPYSLLSRDLHPFPFTHYFNMDILSKNPELIELTNCLADDYPQIRELIQDDPDWAFINPGSLQTQSKPVLEETP